jgi:hypothetical protein
VVIVTREVAHPGDNRRVPSSSNHPNTSFNYFISPRDFNMVS